MRKGIIILSDYNGLPQKSKRQVDNLLREILEKEKGDPQYQIRISPNLAHIVGRDLEDSIIREYCRL